MNSFSPLVLSILVIIILSSFIFLIFSSLFYFLLIPIMNPPFVLSLFFSFVAKLQYYVCDLGKLFLILSHSSFLNHVSLKLIKSNLVMYFQKPKSLFSIPATFQKINLIFFFLSFIVYSFIVIDYPFSYPSSFSASFTFIFPLI